ncbi:MAG: hypothetical protein KAQ98_04325 [Bacteriovoracaceae bacterium]|nr:hypothetical protein [Bacteriovoracaceae bacterium]
MKNTVNNESFLTLKVDTEELTSAQIRLIKTLHSMILHVVTTDKESEFFDGSADLLRMCAALIKQSNFTEKLKTQNGIPYADQALEYSMDILTEHMTNAKVVTYDN